MLALVSRNRARRPYRLLDRHTYNLEDHLLWKVLILSLQSSHSRGWPLHFHRQDGDLQWCRRGFDDSAGTFSSGNPAAVCDKMGEAGSVNSGETS